MKLYETDKRRVVIVDDEPGLLELFQDILGEIYDVRVFNKPSDFLDFVKPHKETPFEILITDLNMPGMTGTEMILSAQSLGFYFPSILLSGYMNKDVLVKALDLGVYRMLEKPTAPNVFISAIEELLVEYDVRQIRQEIRSITGQLREYYSYMRLLVSTHIPETTVKNFAFQTNQKGHVISQESFDNLLTRLETRLEKLLQAETVLEDVRARRYKNIA